MAIACNNHLRAGSVSSGNAMYGPAWHGSNLSLFCQVSGGSQRSEPLLLSRPARPDGWRVFVPRLSVGLARGRSVCARADAPRLLSLLVRLSRGFRKDRRPRSARLLKRVQNTFRRPRRVRALFRRRLRLRGGGGDGIVLSTGRKAAAIVQAPVVTAVAPPRRFPG